MERFPYSLICFCYSFALFYVALKYLYFLSYHILHEFRRRKNIEFFLFCMAYEYYYII